MLIQGTIVNEPPAPAPVVNIPAGVYTETQFYNAVLTYCPRGTTRACTPFGLLNSNSIGYQYRNVTVVGMSAATSASYGGTTQYYALNFNGEYATNGSNWTANSNGTGTNSIGPSLHVNMSGNGFATYSLLDNITFL